MGLIIYVNLLSFSANLSISIKSAFKNSAISIIIMDGWRIEKPESISQNAVETLF